MSLNRGQLTFLFSQGILLSMALMSTACIRPYNTMPLVVDESAEREDALPDTYDDEEMYLSTNWVKVQAVCDGTVRNMEEEL